MSVLDEILEGVRADLAERQSRVSLERLKDMARRAASPRDAMAALKSEGVSVIAEVKRASPSRGAMAEIDDPAALAGALLIFLAGLATMLRGPDWPVMSSKYDAPEGGGAGRHDSAGAARALDSATMWESLNGGDDPTDDAPVDDVPIGESGRGGSPRGSNR